MEIISINRDGNYLQIIGKGEPLKQGSSFSSDDEDFLVLRTSIDPDGLFKSHLVKIETSNQS